MRGIEGDPSETDPAGDDAPSARGWRKVHGTPGPRLLLGLLLGLVTGCEGAPLPPLAGPTWRSADLGLALRLPEGWTLHEGGLLQRNPYLLLDALAPETEARGGLNLNVLAIESGGQSLDELVHGNLSSLRANEPGLEVRDQERITVKGLSVHRVLCRLPDPEGDKSQVLYSFLKDGRFVVLTFTATRPFEEDVEAVARAVVESLTAEG